MIQQRCGVDFISVTVTESQAFCASRAYDSAQCKSLRSFRVYHSPLGQANRYL